MPTYCYTCEKCDRHEEIYAGIQEERTVPTCCGYAMYHNFGRERFGGITNREKGTEYATGFVETFENKEAGRSEQVVIKSRAHHMEELRRRGLQQKGPQSRESVYRRKHSGDFVRAERRENRRVS